VSNIRIEEKMAVTLARVAMRRLAAAAAFANLLALALPASSAAQSNCATSTGAQGLLKMVKGADDKSRIIGAGSLVAEWETSLPTIMLELRNFPGPSTNWSAEQQTYLLSVTDILRSITSNTKAIARFRECDEASMIKPLVWGARGQNPGIRVNATLVLGNVVDNTSVCYVLRHLRDPTISVNGRANLLGVTIAMASYAYKENVAAIEQTLRLIESQTAKEQGDLTPTKKLIAELRSRTNRSPNKDDDLPPALSEPCGKYKYDGPID
jgi:hypothetical protein